MKPALIAYLTCVFTTANAAPVKTPPAHGHSLTWWLVASAGLIALIALGFVIRRWYRSAAAILR